MLIETLNQVAGVEVLNYPEKREKGQGFARIFKGSSVIKIEETSFIDMELGENLTVAYVGSSYYIPEGYLEALMDSDLGDKFSIDEEDLSDYIIGYDIKTKTYYLFHINDGVALTAFFETTQNVEGLPAGSPIFDYGEGIPEDGNLMAYALDGIRRTFPKGSFREIV